VLLGQSPKRSGPPDLFVVNNGWSRVVVDGAPIFEFDPAELIAFAAGIPTGQFDSDSRLAAHRRREVPKAVDELVEALVDDWSAVRKGFAAKLEKLVESMRNDPLITRTFVDANWPQHLGHEHWNRIFQPLAHEHWGANDGKPPSFDSQQVNFFGSMEVALGLQAARHSGANVIGRNIGDCKLSSSVHAYVDTAHDVDAMLRMATAKAFDMELPDDPAVFMSTVFTNPRGVLLGITQPLTSETLVDHLRPPVYVESRGQRAVIGPKETTPLWSSEPFPDDVSKALRHTMSLDGLAVPGELQHANRAISTLPVRNRHLYTEEMLSI
jgi:hypothetical protein